MEEEVYRIINVSIVAQKAEAQPPLGTVLGNIGVNAVKFCNEFNLLTKNLPNYLLIGVKITVFNNRTYIFKITEMPNIGSIFRFLKLKEVILKDNDISLSGYYILPMKDLVQMALYRFPYSHLYNAICTILGYLLPMKSIIKIVFSISADRLDLEEISACLNEFNKYVKEERKIFYKKKNVYRILYKKERKIIFERMNKFNNKRKVNK